VKTSERFSTKEILVIKDEKIILQLAQWTILQGEHWVVLGQNGAGKSTLLRVLLGYEQPRYGVETSWFGETSASDLRQVRKQIGYVSSEYQNALPDWVSGFEMVASGFFGSNALYDELTPKQTTSVEAWLKVAELEHLKDKLISKMSYGELRRFLIARSLVSEPELLVLDEPFNGLDIPSREKILKLLNHIDANKTSLVLVTHHPEEIPIGVTHALLLKNAEVLAVGKKESVLTESLLSKMLDCRIELLEQAGRYWYRVIDGKIEATS
jgi:iron complex transport system ATP-binding protein